MKSINFFLVNLVIVLASFNYSAFGQEKEQTSISDEPAKLQGVLVAMASMVTNP